MSSRTLPSRTQAWTCALECGPDTYLRCWRMKYRADSMILSTIPGAVATVGRALQQVRCQTAARPTKAYEWPFTADWLCAWLRNPVGRLGECKASLRPDCKPGFTLRTP